jgi:hypothetical protein
MTKDEIFRLIQYDYNEGETFSNLFNRIWQAALESQLKYPEFTEEDAKELKYLRTIAQKPTSYFTEKDHKRLGELVRKQWYSPDFIQESQPKWIPIKSYDELPDGTIWVTRVNGTTYIDDIKYIKAIEGHYGYGKNNYIIAYMPFTKPEPYKP